MAGRQPDAKVLFKIESDDGAIDTETLWAIDLGRDRYQLDNSPFFAYSVSWLDVVYAPYDEAEQFPTFESVLEKSGNRTIRIAFDPPVEDGNKSDRVLRGIVELGCSYEGANLAYLAINIPSEVDLNSIRQYLIGCGANWEHADPTYEELFPDET